MVMSAISIGQLVVIALIVVVLFGTNKLRTLGSDLGAALKGFKKAMGDDETASLEKNTPQNQLQQNSTVQQDADFNTSPSEQASQIKREPTETKHQDTVKPN